MENTLFQRYLEGILPPGTPMPNLDLRETVTLRPTTPTEEDLAFIGVYAEMTDHQVIVNS